MNKEDILKILEGAKDKNGDVPMRLVRLAFKKLLEPCTDTISRQAAIDALKGLPTWWADAGGYYPGAQPPMVALLDPEDAVSAIENLPSAQPETAKRIVGKSRNGMTLWYQCDMCNEPVDAQDNFCRGCGRRLTDG